MLKKISLLLVIAVSIVSCNKFGKDEFKITGKAPGKLRGKRHSRKQETKRIVPQQLNHQLKAST